jgi:hypothetical protein
MDLVPEHPQRFQTLRRRVCDRDHRLAGIVVLGDEAAADELLRLNVVATCPVCG